MNPPIVPSKPEVVMPSINATPSVTSTISSMSPENPSLPPRKNKRVLVAIVAVVALTITTLSGFILIARPVLFKSNAWNCGAYVFALSANGTVTVTNNSAVIEPLQRADVFVDNQLVQTFDVPALAAGETKTIGSVTVPTTTFTWQINGTSDCSNAGKIEQSSTSYQCQNIKAYSEDGSTLYTSNSLSALTPGSRIRLVAVGTGATINYQAVRFTINGTLRAQSSLKTSNGDFYEIYTIPTGVTTFSITAQLKGSDGNWY